MTNFGAVPSNADIPESALARGVAAVPVGTILDWFPPASASAPYTSVLPANWIVCAGQAWTTVNANLATVYGSGTTNDLGFTSGNVPNLIGRVTYGASTSVSRGTNGTHSTSNGTQGDPGVGGTVGQNASADTNHRHTVPDHLHGMQHSHGMDHTHTSYIPTKAGGTYWADLTSTYTGAYLVSGGSATTSGTRGSTDETRAQTDGADRDLTSGYAGTYYPENRPAGVGVLKIMKVKYV